MTNQIQHITGSGLPIAKQNLNSYLSSKAFNKLMHTLNGNTTTMPSTKSTDLTAPLISTLGVVNPYTTDSIMELDTVLEYVRKNGSEKGPDAWYDHNTKILSSMQSFGALNNVPLSATYAQIGVHPLLTYDANAVIGPQQYVAVPVSPLTIRASHWNDPLQPLEPAQFAMPPILVQNVNFAGYPIQSTAEAKELTDNAQIALTTQRVTAL